MKTFYKILALVLVIAVTAAISVSITLAYLTDTEKKTNVAVVGDVSIQMFEKQRVEENGEFSDKLEDYQQGKPMYPYVDAQKTNDVVTVGDNKVTLKDNKENYIDKIIYLTNTGSGDAYYRTLVAVPTGGADWEPNPVSANNTWLHWNMPEGYTVDWKLNTTPAFIEKDGVGYYVWEFVGTHALKAKDTTWPVIAGYYMDCKVDNDDNGYFMTYNDGTVKRIEDVELGGTVEIHVVSQAVQTEGFADAQAAFAASFGELSNENAAKWFGDMKAPELVATAEDLTAVLASGGDAVLTDDIKMESATTAPYGNKYAVKLDGGVLDGNGNELYMECYGDDYGVMTSGGTIKNVTIEEGCRAVMIMYPTEDVIIDNANIGGNGVLYPINTGEAGSAGVDLIVTNSTLAGWTSYANIESATFTNVTFAQGTYYNNIYGRVLKPYVNTTLTNCSFVKAMNLDLSSLAQGQKVIISNCTVDGQAITLDTFTIPTTDAQYDTELFTVDLPSWATSVADCIIIK